MWVGERVCDNANVQRGPASRAMQLRLLSLLLCLGAVASSKDIDTRIRNDWRQLIEVCPNRIYRSCGAVDKANWTDAKRTRRLDMLELQVGFDDGSHACSGHDMPHGFPSITQLFASTAWYSSHLHVAKGTNRTATVSGLGLVQGG